MISGPVISLPQSCFVMKPHSSGGSTSPWQVFGAGVGVVVCARVVAEVAVVREVCVVVVVFKGVVVWGVVHVLVRR